MKKPKITDLKFDVKGTKKIRGAMSRAKKIKITVNIDADILSNLKSMSINTGIPYQVLLNRLLRQQVNSDLQKHDRLDRIERELANIKKRLSA